MNYLYFQSATLPRTFRLFRALGLRHLPVVNDTNEVLLIEVFYSILQYTTILHVYLFLGDWNYYTKRCSQI